jgi:methylmalonyl-CoA mutase
MAMLDLLADFPAVTTAEWEAVIQKDLKGADYEKKLVWRLDEGIAVRPYYRAADLAGLETQTQTAPGQFPFVRGSGEAWRFAQGWEPPASAIRADLLHDAGATATQELAYAIAEGVERLASGSTAGDFVFAIGSNYFLEIAKLRAARLLWAQAASAFQPADDASCLMRVHARTARFNKSSLDPDTNLLRVTTEAMSAVLGGCQSLTIEPFGFDEHLAMNIHRILKEEAHLDFVADPAAGSYYIESLTDALAAEAWKLFQQVESEGGFTKAKDGIAKAVAKSRAAKEKAVSTRRRTLIGVNNYPNVKDRATPGVPDGIRLASPFEAIRARTARQPRPYTVLLLKRGDVKMRTARANFCLNFLGCAGFQMSESEELQPADLIVLCSSDPEYIDFARDIAAHTAAPIIVAGNPKEQIEELKSFGVQGFVHIQSDAIQTLTEWQNRLGMEA